MRSRHPLFLSCSLLLANLAIPAGGWAQQGPEQPPAPVPPAESQPAGQFGETLQVTEVLLDVVVTDAKGRVVPGLQAGDFVVEEEGREVPITSVTFVGHRPGLEGRAAPGGRPGEASRPPPLADRFFILFFHDERPANPGLLTRQFVDLSRWLRQWVERDLAFNDYVAVVSYSASLSILTDFTNDKQRIIDAVGAFTLGDKAFGDRPTRDRRGLPSLRANLPEGRELGRATRRVHDALSLVAAASRVIVGRKNLLFFSIGFGRPPEPGFPNWSPDPRYYPQMMETLNDNTVAVYAVDLLPTGDQGSIGDRGLNQSLSQLADDTGGAYLFHFMNFLGALRDIDEASRGYYMLSYSTQVPAGRKGFRDVEVRVRQPRLRVEARRGYRYGGS